MGLYFSICTFIILIVFCIDFFTRKKVNNVETKIYGVLIIVTMLGLFLESLTGIFYNVGLDQNAFYFKFFSKAVLSYYIVWSLVFAHYIISVCHYNKRFLDSLNIMTIIFVILTFVFPISYVQTTDAIMPQGLCLIFPYASCIIFSIIDQYFCIKYRKKVARKKLSPVYIFLVMGAMNIVLQAIIPGLFLLGYILAYMVIIMYFTIENPDVKLINQLELAKNQAEKANRAKTDFLSSMSHEIRTPLNAIVGLSNVIKDSEDIKEIHEDASDVVNASNTLLEIVNGILDISRIEAEKMEMTEISYNPLEEFKSLVNLTVTRIGEKEIELRSDFTADLPNTLYGDIGKIKQIITNLLSNAVKYTEKGHIDFKVTCINDKDTSKLTIIVSDTGRGIKEAQMDKLFTKFNRLEEDMNTTIEGTGLGLAITKSLVEMMGGKIVVDSTFGEGSKFTVFLSQKITNETTVENEKIINTFDGRKVLVVDDNKLNIKVANKVLKEFNLDIDECESGAECINKIENNNKYDIIFMDIMMPKMSGTETLKKLKQIENFNIPVVALTADAIQGKSNKYIEVGFNDYLSKPIDKNELNKVLNKILNKVEVEDEKIEEDPDIHKVIPITDEDIAELNRLFGEPTLISQDEKNDK